jgi:uncharacterized protein YybS (DUF2232 family)
MTPVNDSDRAALPGPDAKATDDWQEWVDGTGSPMLQPTGVNIDEISAAGAIPAEACEAIAASSAVTSASGATSAVRLSHRKLNEPPLALVETAFLASTTSLLWLINAYFPLGPIWRICMPIPIALIYLRWNRREAVMTAAVSGLLLMVFMGPVRSLFFLMPYGFLGVLLGGCWRRQVNWTWSILLGTLVNSLGFFFKVALTSVLLGEDLWIYVTTQVTKILNWLSVNLGLLIQADITLVQLLATLLVLINSVIYLFVVHLVAWYLLDRLGAKVPPPPKWVQVMLELEVD